MAEEPADLAPLRREIEYYKRQLDEVTGANLKLDLTSSGLRHALKRKREGFHLLTSLQQSIGANQELSSILGTTIEAISASLGMDRTIILAPTDEENGYRPSQWIGCEAKRMEQLSKHPIQFPPEFAQGSGLLLVNKAAEPTPLIEELRTRFDLPYFICLPVMEQHAPLGLLLSGRLAEAQPFDPPLDEGDVDTLQAISELITASIGQFRLAVLEEADRLKTEFFANISHEFRTPITLTLGPLDQILKGRYGDVPDAARDQLQTVKGNQERLLGLIEQILDLSKLEAGGMRLRAAPVGDINRFIRERVDLFRAASEQEGVELRLSLDPRARGVELYVDLELLDRLLRNLVANALKFTGQGHVEVCTNVREQTFHLTVNDTGVGIEPDQLPHVFDRFRQVDGSDSRRHAGTGLGLALVKEIAELHGGGVTARSQRGKGSQFQVAIPLGREHLDPASMTDFTEGEAAPADGHPAPRAVSEGADQERGVEQANQATEDTLDPTRPTVLYVEDNPDLRDHVGHLLGSAYNVFLAVDGADGLTKARQYRPDLILTDQMMPNLSGRDLLREIRGDAELNRVPVVFLTARAGTDALIESLDAGADDYLAKPFAEEELLVRIRNLLRTRAQERELEALNRELREASQRKSRFLANMSHELRTPMNAIHGFTGNVLRKTGDVLSARHRDNLSKVILSADHLLTLINSLLDLSRIEAGRMVVEPEQFGVADLIRECCAQVDPLVKRGVDLRCEILDDVEEANTDRGRLHQIAANLLSNAIKYTEQGDVVVRVSRETEGDGPAWLVIAVSDTGAGIPAGSQATIFEEFRQVEGSDPQRKGTGLGLPITKGFAELLGGSIAVQSEEGAGSTFTVRIPEVYVAGSPEEEPGAAPDGLAVPPGSELATLFETAQKGQILAVREQLDRLEGIDGRYGPFVAQLRGHAQSFDVERICELVEPHLRHG